MRKRLRILAIVLGTLSLLALGLGVASAQTTDVYTVNYFSYANTTAAPDGTLRIDNPGLSGGDLCAMIYVFDSFQEMSECCGCLQTPNGLQTFSIDGNLTSNPLTGNFLSTGVIKVVSALPNAGPQGCDPTGGTGPFGGTSALNIKPKANLRTWVTHIQGGGPFYVTETESSASTLGVAELDALQNDCDFIVGQNEGGLGSGHGICSCGRGD